MTNILDEIPETAWRQASIRKQQAALLVIDMQEFFREMVQPIIRNIKITIDACRRAKVPVIFTQHGYEDPEKESGMLDQWWSDHIITGSESWSLLHEISPGMNEKIVAKKRYSAFYGTDLESHLQNLDRKDLIISGVMTNLCCETTARDGFVRDFRIFFLVDGTATVSETYHFSTLRNLAYGFAYLKKCKEVIEELGVKI
jgi:isochorismate hydrolase